jgi:hypothetical protein
MRFFALSMVLAGLAARVNGHAEYMLGEHPPGQDNCKVTPLEVRKFLVRAAGEASSDSRAPLSCLQVGTLIMDSPVLLDETINIVVRARYTACSSRATGLGMWAHSGRGLGVPITGEAGRPGTSVRGCVHAGGDA